MANLKVFGFDTCQMKLSSELQRLMQKTCFYNQDFLKGFLLDFAFIPC